MYKAIFFDVDDTLLNFNLCSQSALSKTFNDFNIEYNDAVYKHFHDIDNLLWTKQKKGLISVQDVLNLRFKQLFSSLDEEIDNIEFQYGFQRNLAKEFVLEPNVAETIEHLSSKYKLYVTSNGIFEMQLNRLKLAGLLPYFSDLFVSEEIGYDKPNKSFFDESIKRSNFKREEILLVGDSLEADIIGANNSNIGTCWYNPYNKIQNVNVEIDYTIIDLLELKTLL